MDWNLIKATRQRFGGEVHANCGRLTPDRLDFIAGRRTRLSSRIGAAYSLTGDGIEKQMTGFKVCNQHPRPASSH